VLSEWWQWEQPQWWIRENRVTTVGEQTVHLGIDKKHLTQDPEYYRDATVWTEWAIVMGTPFPTKVLAYDRAEGTLAREGIWRAQTPQAFRYGLLCRALALCRDRERVVTDEASAIEALGLRPLLVRGRADNLKVTSREDLVIAEAVLHSRSRR
jgi:hypothetical protein